MKRLEDKVAIITGGSGGIGAATAKLFLEEGAKVLLVDLDEGALKKTIEELNSDNASYITADVSKEEQVKKYVDTAVERYGKIDVLFNNAGIEGVVTPLTDYPLDMFEKVININVIGVWLGIKHVFPVMKENGGGSIMITSSIAGLRGTPNIIGYSTSKHAVLGIMRTAALEGAEFNIRVNSINPSPVDNRMMRSLENGYAPGAGDQVKEMMEGNIPMKRYCTSEEVGKVALFLSSDDSSFVNGSVYSVDGGLNAQ
ncbi:MAG: SDR family oxidoreductase [Desulfobacterales bacterium]|jgi:NAD(P)-dependent dehydrogenase (short-subunit alcohol dehydrogenase family)|nr:SDR family oxidoreductase [Desulfobacteraceae bacterium]MBT4365620.1 SDR family oxidoreductase [Desulfobacteraceae bacterium]MBT7086515.1 SDR family oxidoreductase [Desulfobacterales bacterium]MBT7696700.1 SDR family oxidoreductase [Desulfobacterales bacterium]